jgi:hypothetical protein
MLPWQLEGEPAPRYDFLEIKLIRQPIAASKNDRRFTDVDADIKKQRIIMLAACEATLLRWSQFPRS